MFSKHHRRSIADFILAAQEATRPYAFEAIELLSSELAELNTALQSANLGLDISGRWIEKDLGYVAVLQNMHDGQPVDLLRMEIMPLGRKEAMLLVDQVLTEGDDVSGRAHTTYRALDEGQRVEFLFNDVRDSILKAVPQRMRAVVEEILSPQSEEEFPKDYITTKFAGPSEVTDERRRIADAQRAYELSLVK